MIQIRERQFDDRSLLQFASEVIEAVRPAGARVLLNERTDIALACGADGVHLKSDAPPVVDVRRIVPPDFFDWPVRPQRRRSRGRSERRRLRLPLLRHGLPVGQ